MNKVKKGKLAKLSFKLNNLKFGNIGLKALESGIISFKQINIIKNIVLQKTNNKTKIWLPNLYCPNITKKAIGIKMGKGPGKQQYLIFKLQYGNIFLEFNTVKFIILINILKSIKLKLSVKTKIIIFF